MENAGKSPKAYAVDVSAESNADPCKEWVEIGVSPTFGEKLRSIGFERPWPTQVVVTKSTLLRKRSIILSPAHGVGKSALLPIIATEAANQAENDRTQPRKSDHRDFIAPFVMIIAPTRDLAAQRFYKVHEIIQATQLPLNVRACWGERPFPIKGDHGYSDVHIIVGCAGRVSDMLERGILSFT